MLFRCFGRRKSDRVKDSYVKDIVKALLSASHNRGIQELKTSASCLLFSLPVLELLAVSITHSTCLKILFFILVSILGFLFVE